uniref:Uncharacterized protein n=1 Tax=Arundo donax TaxID=35708 RepID=A0A0A8YU41_ARUDO
MYIISINISCKNKMHPTH